MGNNTVQAHELRQLREKYDKNRDGRLAIPEARQMASEIAQKEGLSQPLPDAQLKMLFGKMDKDGSGFITFDEFDGACWALLQQRRQAVAKAKAKGKGKETGRDAQAKSPAKSLPAPPPEKGAAAKAKAAAGPQKDSSKAFSKVPGKPPGKASAAKGAAQDPETAELKRLAVQKGMLFKEASSKSADELRAWLRAQGAGSGGAGGEAPAADVGELKRLAVQRGMLFKEASTKSPEELRAWLRANGDPKGQDPAKGKGKGKAAPARKGPAVAAPASKEEMDAAATKIQTMYRGKAARQQVAQAKAKTKAPGALKRPPASKGQAKQKAAPTAKVPAAKPKPKAKATSVADPASKEEMDAAASKIQAMYRGKAARQQVAQAKAKAKPKAEVAADTMAKPGAKPKPKAVTTAEPKPKASTGPEARPAARPAKDPKVKAEPKPKASTGPEARPAARPAKDPKVKAEPKPKASTSPEAMPAARPAKDPKVKAAAKAEGSLGPAPAKKTQDAGGAKPDRGLMGNFDVDPADDLMGGLHTFFGWATAQEGPPQQQQQQQVLRKQGSPKPQQRPKQQPSRQPGGKSRPPGAAAASAAVRPRRPSSAAATVGARPEEPLDRRFPLAPQLRDLQEEPASSSHEQRRGGSAPRPRRQALREVFPVEDLMLLQGPGATALLPEDPGELSAPESQDSVESISGSVVRSWDPTGADKRYLYARDRAVQFSQPWRPLDWSREDWERMLRETGALASPEQIRLMEARHSAYKALKKREAAEDRPPPPEPQPPEPPPREPRAPEMRTLAERLGSAAGGAASSSAGMEDADVDEWRRFRRQRQELEGQEEPERDPSHLYVRVVSASSLAGAFNLPSDPFVRARVGRHVRETQVLPGTDDPRWEEVLEFRGLEDGETLTLTVWDKDMSGITADVLLGRLDLSLAAFERRLLVGQTVKIHERLRHQLTKDGQAELRVELSFGRAGGAAPGPLAEEAERAEEEVVQGLLRDSTMQALRAEALRDYAAIIERSRVPVSVPPFPDSTASLREAAASATSSALAQRSLPPAPGPLQAWL